MSMWRTPTVGAAIFPHHRHLGKDHPAESQLYSSACVVTHPFWVSTLPHLISARSLLLGRHLPIVSWRSHFLYPCSPLNPYPLWLPKKLSLKISLSELSGVQRINWVRQFHKPKRLELYPGHLWIWMHRHYLFCFMHSLWINKLNSTTHSSLSFTHWKQVNQLPVITHMPETDKRRYAITHSVIHSC